MTNNFNILLEEFNKDSKGRKFELFCKWFLKNDLYWTTQVKRIWLWDEYPNRWGKDCGIDLVFESNLNEIWAIQAKCYSYEYSIKKQDVDKFLSESNRSIIHKRLLIASTDKIGTNANQVCKNQEKPVIKYLLSDFQNSKIDFCDYIKNQNSLKILKKKIPRPHQKKAITDVIKKYMSYDRGSLIMACGTGKTLTTLWIKENLKAKNTIIFAPSLTLLSQLVTDWTSECNYPFEVLCVCSDQTVGKVIREDSIKTSVKDLYFPVETDHQKIKIFLSKKTYKVVFSTYQSSNIINKALEKSNIKFDLMVADEAHRTAGFKGNNFSNILKDDYIFAKRRLFATATPRIFSGNSKIKKRDGELEIFSMNNVKLYGPIFHKLTFGKAISDKLLSDYQVIIIGIDDPKLKKYIDFREIVSGGSGLVSDAKSLSVLAAVLKSINEYNLTKMISFHNRVKNAKKFSHDIIKVRNIFNKKFKKIISSDHISGDMNAYERRNKINLLKEGRQNECVILSNARCLNEGIDVPTLDGIVFVEPRGSQTDIVQSVGRAIRNSPEKKISNIIIPLFLGKDENGYTKIDKSAYKSIWDVINALKSHDEVLEEELNNFRTELGKNTGTYTKKKITKIIFDIPTNIEESFIDDLKTNILEHTTSSWHFFYGLALNYANHNNGKLITADLIYKKYKLGNWVHRMRSHYNNQNKNWSQKLSNWQINKLKKIPGWSWSPFDDLFETFFNELVSHKKKYKTLLMPGLYITKKGYKLGQKIDTYRQSKDKLSQDKVKKLNSIGFIWNIFNYNFDLGIKYLLDFKDKNGHIKVPRSYVVNNFKLGVWFNDRRNEKSKIITKEQKERLLSIEGFSYNTHDDNWEKAYNELTVFYNHHKTSKVKHLYVTKSGFNLGKWVTKQHYNYRHNLWNEKRKKYRVSKLELFHDWEWI